VRPYCEIRRGPSTDDVGEIPIAKREALLEQWRAIGGRTPRRRCETPDTDRLSGVVPQRAIAAHGCERCIGGKDTRHYQCEHLQSRRGRSGHCGWHCVKLTDGPERYWRCERNGEIVDDLPRESHD